MAFSVLTVFGAGILTFFTPCVLPLIPVYLAALTGGNITAMNEQSRGQLIFRAVIFSLGFILVFTLMGFGASSIGAFLSDQKTLMQGIGALLILVFALKFLGLLNIPFMDRIIKADDRRVQTRFGSVNAFIMGIVFAAGWSPCVGPVLGSVLTYTASTTSDPATGGLYLSLYGVGFALPLLVTAAFAEMGMTLIRKISTYLPTIEKSIGVVLIFIAGMLVVDIAKAHVPQTNSGQDSSESKENEEFHQTDLPTMVELYKEDCPICQKMKPVVKRIKNQCDKKGVQIRTIDISTPENRHFVKQYRLIGVPTFVFLDEFEMEVARLVGEQTEMSLKQTISVLRGEPCPGVAIIKDIVGDKPDSKNGNGCSI